MNEGDASPCLDSCTADRFPGNLFSSGAPGDALRYAPAVLDENHRVHGYQL